MTDSDSPPISRKKLLWRIAVRLPLGILSMGLLLFLPAGTFSYWQAWAYLAVLLAPMLPAAGYMWKYDPELLDRRMRTREKEQTQRWIARLAPRQFALLLVICGLDRRFGWSSVSPALVLVADALILLGHGLFFWVLRTNRFASRVIEVEAGQRVISTGPYALVRHPMYSAAVLMNLFTAPALGSYWGLLPAALLFPILMVRIHNEERVLTRDLPGYTQYTEKTRYRLLPGVW